MILTIGGMDKTSQLLDMTMAINDQLNARSTCSFGLKAAAGETSIVGDQVEIYDGETLIFAGTIEDPEEEQPLGTTILKQAIQASDWHQVADRRIVAESYVDKTAGYIANNIITLYLAAEGITAGTIQDGPTIKKAIFNYEQASKCFDELSQVTGYQWRINPNKTLDFFDRATNIAPFGIGETSAIRNLKVRRNRDNYRNRQYLRAGQDVSTVQIRNFAGDGSKQVFTLDLPVALTPTVKLNGVAKTVGIAQLDEGKDFYWQKGEKEITQDDAGTPLVSTDVLRVEYQGFFPIMVVSDAIEAINERKSIEGGTGIYEAVEDKASIDSKDAALDYSDGLLRRYAKIAETITFDTELIGLRSGQLITLELPAHGVSGSFLIGRVDMQDVGFTDGSLRYSVECLSGEAFGGWIQFFKRLAESKATYVIRENEILVKLITFIDEIQNHTLDDSITYHLHQYKLCGQFVCSEGAIL